MSAERPQPVLRWLGTGLCGLGFLFGAAALGGWIFNEPGWRSLLAGGSQMKANTALCLMLLAMGLGLRKRQANWPKGRDLSKVLATIVGAIGALTLLEYWFGWSLGIDQFLFKDTSMVGTSHAG